MTVKTKIKIRSLYKSFGNNKVLNGIDLDIEQGSSLVILGGSGTGKSVLIKSVVGLIEPDKGSVLIDGIQTVGAIGAKKLDIMKKCGFLFQGGALFDSLSIADNVTFFAEKLSNLTGKAKRDLAVAKLEAVGLSSTVLDLYPSELSGGMQKRVSLARAICSNPEIIFFDEPTTGLDPIMANVINELIIKIRKELGSTIIVITHDMNSAWMVSEKVALIYQGKIMWHGDKAEMKNAGNPYLHQFINGLTTGPIEV